MTLNSFQIIGITILVLGIYCSRYYLDKAFTDLPEDKQLLILRSFKSSRHVRTIIHAVVAIALIFLLTRNPIWVIEIQYAIASYVMFRVCFQYYIAKKLKKLDLPLRYLSFYNRCVIIHYLCFALFLFLFIFGQTLEQHFEVDKCLDGGGRYDYDSNQCSNN